METSLDIVDAARKNAGLNGSDDANEVRKVREAHLEACMQKLPSQQRELLVLRFYQGLSFEMISEITGFSQSAVKMRVYRGLEKLREIMSKM